MKKALDRTAFRDFKSLDCLDRMVITGNIPEMQHHDAMRAYCKRHRINEFKIPNWASPIRDRLDAHFHDLAIANGATEVGWNNKISRKDDFVKGLLTESFRYGIIAVIKSMEGCRTFYRAKGKMVKGSPFYLRSSKCVHYYLYINDKTLGLCQIRIQTYAPFTIQIIVNGHRILERMMIGEGIRHTTDDNCFSEVSDLGKAQTLADSITAEYLDEHLHRLTDAYLPLSDVIETAYRFTIRQAEYSKDIYLEDEDTTSDRFQQLIQQMALQNPQDIITYIHDRKRAPRDPRFKYLKSDLGSCIRYTSGPLSVKAYHKLRNLLRIETTSRDQRKISAIKTTHHKNGTASTGKRPLSRSIFDLPLYTAFANQANQRFSQRLEVIWDRTISRKPLDNLCHPVMVKGKSCKGFNFFDPKDRSVMAAIHDPVFDIKGVKRSNLIKAIPGLTPSQASYYLKRLRHHQLVKKEHRSHSYTLTYEGRRALTAFRHVEHLSILLLLSA
jgi:hypothetical protein